MYHYVSKLCASIIIDQNRMNLSNLDSAFEKTCIPIPIPYSQTSCLKAGFVKFGTESINIDQAADFWYLYNIYILYIYQSFWTDPHTKLGSIRVSIDQLNQLYQIRDP